MSVPDVLLQDHPSSDSFYDSDNAEPENPPVVDEEEAPDIEVDGEYFGFRLRNVGGVQSSNVIIE